VKPGHALSAKPSDRLSPKEEKGVNRVSEMTGRRVPTRHLPAGKRMQPGKHCRASPGPVRRIETVKHSSLKWFAFSLVLTVSLTLLVQACTQEPETADVAEIIGTVTYRERIMLPPDALVTISLEDTARMDIKSEEIASTGFVPQGGPPWDFVLEYDPGKINDRGRYALRAKIEVEGRLMFTSTENIPAFEGEAGKPVQILVYRVSGKNDADTPPPSNANLTDTYWKLTEIDGKPAQLGVNEKEVHMILVSETSRVKGFSGCNTFTGAYEVNEERLTFSQMAVTMMACAEGMEQEQRFLLGMEKTSRYGITGETLQLRGENG